MLHASVMLLGAVCVLLLAGGLPWGGVEEVYRGGLMCVLGGVSGLLSFWMAWKNSLGYRLRMGMGVISLFFVAAGLRVLVYCGQEVLRCAGMGGGMWFGAVGMGCFSVMGLLFSAIFGYLAYLSLRVEKLWLAVAHLSFALLVAGAFVDICSEQRYMVTRCVGERPTGHCQEADQRLPFAVGVENLQVSHYENAELYRLIVHQGGHWMPVAIATRRGTRIRCGQEEWDAGQLRALPGSDERYLALPGKPLRILVQQPGPVKEYRAVCRLAPAGGGGEAREVTLRVNEPASWDGWQIYLMNCSADGSQVQLLLRRAPGRPLVFAGLLGVLLCCFAWAFGYKRSIRV